MKMVNWRELRGTITYCPLCCGRRVMIKWDANEMAVRCVSCLSSVVTMSIASVLHKVAPDLRSLDVYELSSRGPLFRYLRKYAKSLTFSEFFTDVVPGEFRRGIQCQDVQQLSYASASFDLCTSTEVIEHVPDDAKGFLEIFRVLRPNGIFVFTVPLHREYQTIERAIITGNGDVQHLLHPEYHGDPIRKSVPILAFRNYGQDITERLRNAGFAKSELILPEETIPWGFARPVVVAYRGTGTVQNCPLPGGTAQLN